MTNLLNESEHTYYKNTLHEAKSNSKKMFTICNSLLRQNTSLPLPPGHSDSELAESFNIFFTSKISRIRSELMDLRIEPPDASDVNDQIPPSMDCFQPLSQVEVETEIINKSLTSGIFPDRIKVALVRPLLKKANLDLIEKNYRPISNIEFIGKSIERAVTAQINRHITSHNLIEPHQSAYQPCHSTKTALLKVKSDLISAIGNQEIACLILLDLSAAFDMVDTGILLQRLTNKVWHNWHSKNLDYFILN